MDQQSRLAVLGTLGLATVAIYCAILFSGRLNKAGSSESGASGSRGVSASSKTLDDDGEGDAAKDTGKAPFGDGGDAAATAAAAAAGGKATAKDGGKSTGEGGTADDETEALVARFNRANSKARKLFSGQRYDLAAEQYAEALKLCDVLPDHDSKRTALHNNRGAAYEKGGQYALALADCSICLSREAGHKFARIRKSRVLEALGKEEEALSEVCAHLLLERDRVQAKAALNPSEPLTPPPPPANLEGLLQKVAAKRADAILKEREEAAAKEVEAAGASGAGKVKRKPLVKQAVTELLRSFGSFSDLERRYRGMQEADLTQELETEEVGGEAIASRVSNLLDRGLVRLSKRNYDASREDIFEAAEMLSNLGEGGTPAEEAGVSSEVQAAVWEWQGTYLQLSGDLDAAMKAYERCGEGPSGEEEVYPADVLIKMAWVSMDKEDTTGAKALFSRAMESYPDYGTSFAHRARLDSDNENAGVVKGFLEKAIELNSTDAFAWDQLCRIYVQAGDVNKATTTIDEGLKAVPGSDALLTLKAELKYSTAIKNQDGSSCMEILRLFDEAIRANPTNPVLYLNKAAFLLQMMSDVGGAMEMLEKGVSVDPTSVNALVQLANLKIMVAREMADAEAATALIDKAVALCTTRDELLETLSVRVATEGRIEGARLLGRTTLG